jgi:hypothetical protein
VRILVCRLLHCITSAHFMTLPISITLSPNKATPRALATQHRAFLLYLFHILRLIIDFRLLTPKPTHLPSHTPQRALIPWLSIKFGVHRDCRPWVEIFDREGARLKRRTAGWRRAVCTSEFAFGFGFALCKLWLLCAKEKVGVGVISAL